MSAWDLMKSGSFTAAVSAYSDELERNESGSVLFNRALAWINSRNYSAALRDLRRIGEIEPAEMAGDSHRNWVGVCRWLSSEKSEALEEWLSVLHDHQRNRITYSDAVGGIDTSALVFFGGVSLHASEASSAAIQFMRKRIKTSRAENWPGPIARFLCGTMTADELFAAVRAAPEVLYQRELCQAAFYAAIAGGAAGAHDQLTSNLRRAAACDLAILEPELYLARHESHAA